MSEQIGFQHQNFMNFLICDFCARKASFAGSYSKSNQLVARIYRNTYYLQICASNILSTLLLKDPRAKNHIFAQST